jgi:peptide/nickel transport system ATP-binding protein
VSLRIGEGEALGLVGESGSGKTMLSLALMGLLPPGARISGEASLATKAPTKKLTTLAEREWREARGGEIAMVFQEPMTSLNPVMRIGAQIEEAIRAHQQRLGSGEVKRKAIDSLRLAAVPEPEIRAEQFPHQLSGGLRQRAMIAMALAAGPRLLIADEPTTALDVTVQKQLLDLLDRLRRELQLGLLFITHDLGVVAQVAERVAVMYAGRIIEEGPARSVLARPLHPYTQGLLRASPTLKRGTARSNRAANSAATNAPPRSRRCESFVANARHGASWSDGNSACRWSLRWPHASPSCAPGNSWKWATPNRSCTSQNTTTPANCFPPSRTCRASDPIGTLQIPLLILPVNYELCDFPFFCARIPPLKYCSALVRSPSGEGSSTQTCGGGVLDGYNPRSRAAGASANQPFRPDYRSIFLS